MRVKLNSISGFTARKACTKSLFHSGFVVTTKNCSPIYTVNFLLSVSNNIEVKSATGNLLLMIPNCTTRLSCVMMYCERMRVAITTTMPNKQMAMRRGDFKTSLNSLTPCCVILHTLMAIPAMNSTITAMANAIIKGVKRNLNFLASWGAF